MKKKEQLVLWTQSVCCSPMFALTQNNPKSYKYFIAISVCYLRDEFTSFEFNWAFLLWFIYGQGVFYSSVALKTTSKH